MVAAFTLPAMMLLTWTPTLGKPSSVETEISRNSRPYPEIQKELTVLVVDAFYALNSEFLF